MDKTETKEMEGEFECHTPGPLEVLHTQSDGFAIDYNNGNLMRRFIAMKIYNKGDANLFAAAPTLLKENQSLRFELHKAKEENQLTQERIDKCMGIADLRERLEKAKELNGELVAMLKSMAEGSAFLEKKIEALIKKI